MSKRGDTIGVLLNDVDPGITLLESEINALGYKLHNLTAQEKLIVENNSISNIYSRIKFIL